ncbi:SUKH-4 family immunity protein [Streptomyces sp. NPDC047072]|uniref:SUKH-4 family immunity protein n=1 Tax=Streptomyces sp. NPDC047072 TaxID=3154809 RepID=UPI0033EFE656
MIAPVTAELLRDVFPQERISRVPPDRQSAVLAHAESRAFLADIGIPRAEGVLIEIRDDLPEGLTPLLSHRPTADFAEYEDAPDDFTRWIHLGKAATSDLALDGETGIVYDINDEVRAIQPMHTDLSSMVYGMWLLEKRRPDYDPEDTDEMLPVEEMERVADEIQADLSRVDPLPFAGPGWWEGVVSDIAGGMW